MTTHECDNNKKKQLIVKITYFIAALVTSDWTLMPARIPGAVPVVQDPESNRCWTIIFFINLSLGQNPFWRLLEVIAANNSVAALQAALDSHTTPDVVTQYLHVVLNYL